MTSEMCSELACPLCCISSFPNIETFKLNLIKVNSKPIKCPLCNEVLLGLDKLTIHLFGHQIHGSEDNPFANTADEKVTEVPLAATKPKKEPKAKQNRTKSVKNSSPIMTPPDETFRCEVCGFVFVDEALLSLHLSLVHNFTPSNDDDRESAQSSRAEIQRFHCHLCTKHFKMKGALRIHIRVAHFRFHDQNQQPINIADYLKNQKIEQCTRKAEMLSLKEPHSPENYYQQRSPSIASSPASYFVPSPQNSLNGDTKKGGGGEKNAKIFQCEDCKKTFTTKYFLKKHKRLHTGEQPFTCEKCGKNFFFQQSFHKHKLYCMHSDEKPYECAECGRSFKELSTLHNHERIHSGVKPFGCEICGKYFRQRVSYLVHSRIHNGALPYKCSECGKGFRYKVSQKAHVNKCSGTLVKQPGELIQKLMLNSSILPPSTVTTTSTVVSNETINLNVEISNANQHESHELCLDDLLKDDSYEKLMKSSANETRLIPHLADNAFSDNSDMMAFNNLAINPTYCMTSLGNNNNFMSSMNFPPTLETINEDSIKELLGDFSR